ncbi:hypothetical protein CC80DRAFT_551926 [Byssothecium circinans]|uniref:Ankyrin n=1 Tax=Byssothecium circinans TaxID=147558 RepID=A0A6A5TJ85_9PLEO|nr:hypothetical protein CC80DRAFT_551926 [Byssothecium circinans]
MDPASIIGLVAACGSLATICFKAVHALRSLADTYKHLEISIIALVEECATIQLAWKEIATWADRNIQQLDNHEGILDRLARSVYAGQLMMAALQADVDNAVSKPNGFRRNSTLVFSARLLQEHEHRIRGQTNALQLLLQVISMPRDDERAEVLTITEPVFREVDDSVLSIVPSRMSSRWSSRISSRPSTITDDTKTGETKAATRLKYIRFSFENDLFTSYVYKRNYRTPMPFRGPAPTATKPDDKEQERNDQISIITSDSILLPGPRFAAYQNSTVQSSITLCPIVLIQGDYLQTATHADINFALLESVVGKRWVYSMELLSRGADIAMLTQSCSLSMLLAFLWCLYVHHTDLFLVLLRRMALSSGLSWVNRFDKSMVDHRTKPGGCNEHIDWKTKSPILSAARFSDEARVHERIPVLQLACTARHYREIKYLTTIGFSIKEVPAYNHPGVFAIIYSEAIPSWLRPTVTTSTISLALVSLFYDMERQSIHWATKDGVATRLSLVDATRLFIRHGADVECDIVVNGHSVPLPHGAALLISKLPVPSVPAYMMFESLLQAGADPNASCKVSSEDLQRTTLLSLCTTLAKDTGHQLLVDVVVKHGAIPPLSERRGWEREDLIIGDEDDVARAQWVGIRSDSNKSINSPADSLASKRSGKVFSFDEQISLSLHGSPSTAESISKDFGLREDE